MSSLRESIAWQLRNVCLRANEIPLLMGVVNVTPDSFSDGGRYLDPSAAVDYGLQLVSDGADLLDIGGQSTRPGALPVESREELRRVLSVVERLAAQTKTPVSVDTFSAVVARETLAAGAEAINDITAATADAGMLAVVRESNCGLCIMHMQGTPQTMQIHPKYRDVCSEVACYLSERRDEIVAEGVDVSRIAIDPGIGFGKTLDHNLDLMRNLAGLHKLGQPIVVGVSRKAFIGKLLDDPTIDRTFGTIGASIALAIAGASVLRVHDVAAVRQALIVFKTLQTKVGSRYVD